jgi:hypothetical protein
VGAGVVHTQTSPGQTNSHAPGEMKPGLGKHRRFNI